MNSTPFGVYVYVLRERQDITRLQLATAVGVQESSIWRIEEEGQLPRAALLVKIAHAVRASLDDISALLTDSTITEEDARAMAYARFAAMERGLPDTVRRSVSDARQLDHWRREEIARELRRLAEDYENDLKRGRTGSDRR